MYDVIIIGSGPAGLSAAVYAARAKLNTLVIEEKPLSGGQIINTYEVDNYPGLPGISGFELAQKMREHADKMEVEFLTAQVTAMEDKGNVKVVMAGERAIETRTILIASGAEHRKLSVPGENALSGMGVSYCATCDGAFFKNRTVAVIGGGDVALEDALFLARGCKKVYLIHRRDEFRGAKVLQEQVMKNERIEILYDTVVEEIQGEDMVQAVAVYNKKRDVHDTLAVNGVFIAVGIIPNNAAILHSVEMDEQGYVVAGEDCVTNVTGIFAAGDVRTKQLRQVITAAADGANAVTSIGNYLLTL